MTNPFSRSLDRTCEIIELRREVDDLRKLLKKAQEDLLAERSRHATPEEREFVQAFHPIAEM